MAKTYTFSEAQKLLGIDAKTFRRWLEKAQIDPTKQVSTLDERIRYLTEDQLQKLAQDHGRDINAPQRQAEAQEASGAVSKLKLLVEQQDERLGVLETRPYIQPVVLQRLDELQKQYDDLERKYAASLEQLTNALLALKDLQDWKAAQESKPRPGRKPKAQGEAQAVEG